MVPINDVPSVVIPTQNGLYKHILIKVTDEMGNEKMIVRCGGPFHRIILMKFLWAEGFIFARGRRAQCLGGGKMTVQREGEGRRRLIIFGKSLDFGAEDRQLTTKILKDSFPDFEIIVAST